MQYTTTSQEIFETFCISKTHKKHLKIDENNKTIYFNYPEKEVEINYELVNILYEDAFYVFLKYKKSQRFLEKLLYSACSFHLCFL